MRYFYILVSVFFLSLLLLPQGLVAGTPEQLPEKAIVKSITGKAQKYNLSCESRSAVDLALFWGVQVSETRFLNSLPRSDNPDQGFVGNPNGPWGYSPPQSYGVHAQPVANVLRELGLRAVASKGLTWDQLRSEIAAGRPVLVWVIGHMWGGKSLEYQSEAGDFTTVARFEHSMLLVGYDPAMVYVIDPSHGKRQTYSVKEFKRSWNVLGNMAVMVTGQLEPDENLRISVGDEKISAYSGTESVQHAAQFLQDDRGTIQAVSGSVTYQQHVSGLPLNPLVPPAYTLGNDASQSIENKYLTLPIVPITYKVQYGDTLTELATRFGLNWKHLAVKNGIEEPYFLIANQVLVLGE